MNGDVDLRELWQSQPVDTVFGGRVPRFGLLEDLTVPVYAPLSPWRRANYVLLCAWFVWTGWRQGNNAGWLPQASFWFAVGVGLVGVVLVLLQRDRTHPPQPEESVHSYRTALFGEFERQIRVEKRIILLLWGGCLASSTLEAAAQILKRGAWDLEAVGGLVFLILVIAAADRMYRRATNAVRSRLKLEAE